ncbi:MAG: hypothetical protein JW880_03575 [Candidatus Thermoplasmatota archaeon]|nr:hypothetical protein [Candidatus Thermoplasmatota archaeon]
MRPRVLSAVVMAALLLVLSGSACADIPDPGAPSYANSIMSDFVTPVVRPGEIALVSFNISNPYEAPEGTMVNTTLVIGVYWYAAGEAGERVDDEFPNPPSINGNGTSEVVALGMLDVNSTRRVNLSIETTKRTPHGSYFSQSTYFLRFRMIFSFEGNSSIVVLQSRGCFTEEQWSQLVSFDTEQPLVNTTYLKSLGIDGLLPDSSFGIKTPIPKWPLGLLVAGCAGLCFGALYFFVMDNPGKYPELEKRFYYLRGKLGESWRQLQHRGRK